MDSVKPNQNAITTAHAGPDIREVRKVYREAISSQIQLELIQDLVDNSLGFRDIEDFLSNQWGKFKTENIKVRETKSVQIKHLMQNKLADAKERCRIAKKDKESKRKELDLLYGLNTSRCRNVFKKVNKEMQEFKSEQLKKKSEKVKWLLSRYKRETEDNKINFHVPGDIEEYKNIRVFDNNFSVPEDVKNYQPEIAVVGDIQPPLDEEELSVLRLNPKTAINPSLSIEGFKIETGMCSSKLRWEIRKEEDEKIDDEEEISEEDSEMMAEIEARARMPFDPRLKELDLRKKRVTDSKDNSMVHMPRPVSVKEEASISVRETTYESVFKKYFRENCSEKGKQSPNLSKSEMSGLKKLKKRIDDGSIVIMESDKSGKFCVASIEAYAEMGQVHIKKDKEIDQQEVDDRERVINGHVSMLLKILSMGKSWKHEDRFRESNITHSGLVADLSLRYKDHKDVVSTRPVVSGNEGTGANLSNILSEVIEPLADSMMDKFEINSTEDGISRIDACNEKLANEWKPGDIIGLIGADVSKLFQSMSARNTARIVREAFLESDLMLPGINYQTAALYIRIGMTDTEIRAAGVTAIVPVRKYTKGQAPGITSKESMHADTDRDLDKWIFPSRELTNEEQRKLMGAVLEIAIRASWENSMYSFAGSYYLQKEGGPTGRRLTMAASRIVMGSFGKKLNKIMEDAGITVWMKSAYVDDIRKVITLFRNTVKSRTDGRYYFCDRTHA